MEYVNTNLLGSTIERKTAELAQARANKLNEINGSISPQTVYEPVQGLGGVIQQSSPVMPVQPNQPVNTQEQILASIQGNNTTSSDGVNRLGNLVDLAQQGAGRIVSDIISTVPDVISGTASRVQSVLSGEDLTGIQQGYKAKADQLGLGQYFDKNFNFTGLDFLGDAKTWGADESRIQNAKANLDKAYDSGDITQMAKAIGSGIVDAGPEVFIQSLADMYLLGKSGIKKGIGTGTAMLTQYINEAGNEREAVTGKAQTPEELGLTALAGAAKFALDKIGADEVLGNTQLTRTLTNHIFNSGSEKLATEAIKTIAKKGVELSGRGTAEGFTESLQGLLNEFGSKFGTEKQNELTKDPLLKKAFSDFGLGFAGGTTGSVVADTASSPKLITDGVTSAVNKIGDTAMKSMKELELRALSEDDRQRLSDRYKVEEVNKNASIDLINERSNIVSNAQSLEELTKLNDPVISQIVKDSPDISFEDLQSETLNQFSRDIKNIESKFKEGRTKDTVYTVLNNLKSESKQAVETVSTKAKEVGDKIVSTLSLENIPDLTTAINVTKAIGEYSADDTAKAYKAIKNTAKALAEDTEAKASDIRDVVANLKREDVLALKEEYPSNTLVQKAVDAVIKQLDNKTKKQQEAEQSLGLAKTELKSLPDDNPINQIDNAVATAKRFSGSMKSLYVATANALMNHTIKSEKLKDKLNVAINELKSSEYYKENKEDIDKLSKYFTDATGSVVRAFKNTEPTSSTKSEQSKPTKSEPKISKEEKVVSDYISSVIENKVSKETLAQDTQVILEDLKSKDNYKKMIEVMFKDKSKTEQDMLLEYVETLRDTTKTTENRVDEKEQAKVELNDKDTIMESLETTEISPQEAEAIVDELEKQFCK